MRHTRNPSSQQLNPRQGAGRQGEERQAAHSVHWTACFGKDVHRVARAEARARQRVARAGTKAKPRARQNRFQTPKQPQPQRHQQPLSRQSLRAVGSSGSEPIFTRESTSCVIQSIVWPAANSSIVEKGIWWSPLPRGPTNGKQRLLQARQDWQGKLLQAEVANELILDDCRALAR